MIIETQDSHPFQVSYSFIHLSVSSQRAQGPFITFDLLTRTSNTLFSKQGETEIHLFDSTH